MNIAQLGIKKVFIEVTNFCNFRCEFCPITICTRKPQHLDFELVTQAIDEISREKIADSVAFYLLGEPLVYSHIFEAVQYARDRGLRTEITTNGSLLTEERVKGLACAGLDKLTISLQRFGEFDHQARRAPMPFDRYYERILEAVRHINNCEGQTEVVLMFMHTANKKLLDVDIPMNMSWNRRSFEKDLTAIIHDLYAAAGVENEPSNKQVKSAVGRLSSYRAFLFRINERTLIAIKPFLDWGNAFTNKKVYPSRFGYCGLAFSTLSILSNGDVVICCGDYDGKTSLGTIGEDSLSDILLSDKARAIHQGLKQMRLVEPRCQFCFGSTSRAKTLFRALVFSGMFRFVKPGPDKQLKEIYLLGARTASSRLPNQALPLFEKVRSIAR